MLETMVQMAKDHATLSHQPLAAFLAEYSQMTPGQKSEKVTMCRRGDLRKADAAKITLGIERTGIRKEILEAWVELSAATVCSGRAPSSYLHRELQAWLAALPEKK